MKLSALLIILLISMATSKPVTYDNDVNGMDNDAYGIMGGDIGEESGDGSGDIDTAGGGADCSSGSDGIVGIWAMIVITAGRK